VILMMLFRWLLILECGRFGGTIYDVLEVILILFYDYGCCSGYHKNMITG